MAYSSFSNPALDYIHPAFSVRRDIAAAPLNDAVFLPTSSNHPQANSAYMLTTCSGDGAIRVHDVSNGNGDVTQERILEGKQLQIKGQCHECFVHQSLATISSTSEIRPVTSRLAIISREKPVARVQSHAGSHE
jgi:hypothetical protein